MQITEFRNSAKAIIVENGRLLTICRLDPRHGEWFLLPGGGQHPGEILHEALRREVREETGIEIEIGELVFVRDYIGAHHEFAETDARFHQVEFMFLCRRASDAEPANGHEPDKNQVRVEWLPLDQLADRPFYPKTLARILSAPEPFLPGSRTVYLGDVN